MGGATNCPETPRQKMIGMMYIVLTAMLALNVSADILQGFKLVEESLKVNIHGTENRNTGLYAKFEDLAGQNPEKVGEWLTKAKKIRAAADKMYTEIDDIKLAMVRLVDGEEVTMEQVKNGEVKATSELNASTLLLITQGRGAKLRADVDGFRNLLLQEVLADKERTDLINKTFDTSDKKNLADQTVSWEMFNFYSMPVAAALTLLTKMQADVRNLEGEVVSYMRNQIDADDFRVNDIAALVVPNSKYVIKGDSYEARIVLAARDTTQKPQVYIGGNPETGEGGTLLEEDGVYKVGAGAIGERKYAGYIKVQSPTAGTKIYPFESDYSVGEATAIISADKMNVFYAKVDNPVSISVPGIPSSSVRATMTNGSLKQTPSGGWIVRPERAGTECVISVFAKVGGREMKMADGKFRVKLLPPPVAYIPYPDGSGNTLKYKGGEKISKQYLINLTTLGAELDDSDFDVPYTVTKFELNITGAMGSTIEASAGASFTERQQRSIREMAKGKKFFISGIEAVGPEGPRKLKPLEVIVN